MNALVFVKHTASTLLARVLILGLTFLIGVVTARALGPKGLGAFALAVLVPSLVSLFLQFGVGVANVYFIGRNRYPADVLLGNALSLSLLTSLVFLPLYWAAIPLIRRTFIREVDAPSLALVGLAIPLALVGGHLSYIFLGLQRIYEFNWLKLTRNGSTLLLLLILVVAFGTGVRGAIVATLLAWAIMVAVGFLLLREAAPIRLSWDWPSLWACLKLGVQGYFANMIQFFNYRLDVLILGYFLGVAEVGIYATAVGVVEVLWYLPEAVATVLFPRTASADPAEARLFTPRVSRNVFALTLLASLVVAAFSHPLVIVFFSARYESSISPLRLLLPGVVVLSVGKVLAGDLAGRGLLMYNTWASLIAMVATVAFDLALIPRWGVDGAAIASTISYALMTVVLLAFYTRTSANGLTDMLLVKRSDWQLYHEYWAKIRRFALARWGAKAR